MLKIYNTLTRSIQAFDPQNPPLVTMYSCGPTVYDFQHIGHMRRYVGDDLLVGVLKYNGFKVDHVMNITDVGHLVSDADSGEDKMEKGARKYGKSVWDIAKEFEEQFWLSMDELAIQRPDKVMHATDYITEQIALVKKLEEKGYTYKTDDGIYFDTTKFSDYYKLSRQKPEELKAGARVEVGLAEKKHPSDFALWKFDPEMKKARDVFQLPSRQMDWYFEGSDQGDLVFEGTQGNMLIKNAVDKLQKNFSFRSTIGFPGWHIECSAMSMDALGATLDIHTGGIDHIAIHHTNEIAQSEAATGKEFVKYWVHHNFLVVNGEKMSKSLGNFYTVQDVMEKGFDPMSLRYLYLQTHYRQEMNFTWESLEAAEKAYHRLIKEVATWDKPSGRVAEFEDAFLDAINDDLNMPKALAVVWELMKSEQPTAAKAASLAKVDTVLRLNIFNHVALAESIEIPQNIKDMVIEREGFRKAGDFAASDEMREKIRSFGWEVKDTKEGSHVNKL